MIVPVPEENTQQAVADGTVLVINDTEVGRIWPGWSPDDTALLYRRGGDGGTCSVPPKKGHPNGVPVNFVIGMLDNPDVVNVSDGGTDDPDKIECDDETVLDSDGFQPEWWRGDVGFPPPSP